MWRLILIKIVAKQKPLKKIDAIKYRCRFEIVFGLLLSKLKSLSKHKYSKKPKKNQKKLLFLNQ